jgi:threonyl-tRNA synthetase
VQVVIAAITNDVDDYARKIYEKLKAAGIRVKLDLDSDKIGYKIRKHSLAKVPVIVALGKQEQEKGTVAYVDLVRRSKSCLN